MRTEWESEQVAATEPSLEPNWFVFCPDRGAPSYFPAATTREAQEIAAHRFRNRPGALFHFDPSYSYPDVSTTTRAKLQSAS